ncbi:MAG: AAA family ATPase [Geminicoccaceae bacterium]|nr:AAA family ATPase [Geminicoccaceae bacterium]
MRIERLALRHFRTHRAPVRIESIGPGLTVVAGANEEGKSTILTALRAAFFLSANISGDARASLVPYGTSEVPEVEVAFVRGGRRYDLRKRFQRGGTVLVGPDGERLQGEPAEARIETLLGFERPNRASARELFKPEHMGLQALFWLEQGKTFEGFAPVAATGRRLAGFMEDEVGAVAAGEAAKALLAKVTARRNLYYTEKRGDPTGALRDARIAATHLEGEIAELAHRREEFDERLGQLARRRDERRRLIEADALGRAEAEVRRLDDEVERAKRLADAHRIALSEAEAAGAALEVLQRRSDERTRLAHDLDALTREATVLAAVRDERAAEVEAALVRMVAAGDAVTAARAARDGIEASRARAVRVRERAEREARLVRLVADAVVLEALLATRRDKTAAAAAIPVTEREVEGLRRLEAAVARAETSLAVAATTLRLDLVGIEPTKDGVPLASDAALHMSGPTLLGLGPYGAIRVLPGGEGLRARQDAFDAARAALAEALDALGVPSVGAATLQAERRRDLSEAAARAEAEAQAVLRAHGQADTDALEGAILAERERIARLGDAGEGDDLAAIEHAASAANVRLAAAEDKAEELRTALQTAREASAGEAADARTVASRRLETEGRLADLRADLDDAAMAARLDAASERSRNAEAASRLWAGELGRAEPDLLRERQTMARRRLEQEATALRGLERAIDALEAEVRALGGAGIDLALAEAKGDFEAASRRLERLTLEAEAWRLLHEEMAKAEGRRRARVMAPIQERLRPYVRRLLADAEPVLAEDSLHLTGLARRGEEEAFGSLSIGTREQLAVLVRLAFADLALERGGESPCLILDDALVYADEDRLERMKTILQQAAGRHQILLLTCRRRDYLGLDADFRSLEDCRTEA